MESPHASSQSPNVTEEDLLAPPKNRRLRNWILLFNALVWIAMIAAIYVIA